MRVWLLAVLFLLPLGISIALAFSAEIGTAATNVNLPEQALEKIPGIATNATNETEDNVSAGSVETPKFEFAIGQPESMAVKEIVLANIDPAVVEALAEIEEVPVVIKIEEEINSEAGAALESIEDPLELQYFEESDVYAGELNQEQLDAIGNISGIVVEKQREFSITLSSSAPAVNATKVWPIVINGQNITGKNQTVCVVDTGINYSHAALGGCFGSGCRVLNGYDFVNSDADPMDDHNPGHGTHVAGIIASNDSTYRGMAFEANLIAIKSFNSGGTASSQNIANGIKWCVDNALNVSSTSNITVISMSFGDNGNYSAANCPTDSLIDPQLNSANAAGLFMVVAAGNTGNQSGIGYPGCNANVTAVGAVNNADSVTSFSNVGDAMDLWAAGSSITSTVRSGSFSALSGTSMSTPHVSGVAALLLHYKKLRDNTVLTSAQLKTRLEKTGFNVTANSINRPRVNALYATQGFDIKSPLNQSYATGSVGFNISGYSTLSSANVSVDGGFNNSMSGLGGGSFSNISISVSSGFHNATFYAVDSAGELNFATVFFSVDATSPQIILNSPANGSTINRTQNINFTVTDNVGVHTVWYARNGTSSNVSLASTNSTFLLNITNWTKGRNNITVFANDSAGNANFTSNLFFTVNASLPSLTISFSPASPFANQTINCSVNAVDPDGDPVTVFFRWRNASTAAILNTSQTYNCSAGGCAKNNVLTCEATPNDGVDNGTEQASNVTIANAPPSWAFPTTNFSVAEDNQTTIDANATDVDNDTITYSLTNLPSGASINSSTGIFTWTPADTNVGNNVFTFRAGDGTDNNDINITLTVNNTNDPPTLSSIGNQDGFVDERFDITITASDDDIDSGDNLTFLDNTSLFNINKTTNTTAEIEFTPTSSNVGEHIINITVKDTANAADSEVFRLTIEETTNGGTGTGGGAGAGAAPTATTPTAAPAAAARTEDSLTFSSISPDEPASFRPQVSGLSVFSIVIKTKVTTGAVTAVITKLSSVPIETPDEAYQYFDFTATGLTEESIDEIEITFDVPASFAEGKRVYLATLVDDEWTALPTKTAGTTDGTTLYTATTTHLSTFAILGSEELFGFPTAAFTGLTGVSGSSALILIGIIIVVMAIMFAKSRGRRTQKEKPRPAYKPQPARQETRRDKGSPDFGF